MKTALKYHKLNSLLKLQMKNKPQSYYAYLFKKVINLLASIHCYNIYKPLLHSCSEKNKCTLFLFFLKKQSTLLNFVFFKNTYIN